MYETFEKKEKKMQSSANNVKKSQWNDISLIRSLKSHNW